MTHINQRRDTATNWATTNPVLQLGEVGWEIDVPESNGPKGKVGDGVTAWQDLPYLRTTATKADVGLSDVDNTSDSDKPISNLTQTALDSKANLASPVFTGNPQAPTPPFGDNDGSIATTAFANVLLETALEDYAPLDSPALTGNPTAPTATSGDNDTSIATTAFVQSALTSAMASGTNKIRVGTILIQWGQVNPVAMGGNQQVTGTVTFPVAFSAIPYAIMTNLNTSASNKLMSSQANTTNDATQFSYTVRTGDGTTSSANPMLMWLAIGPA